MTQSVSISTALCLPIPDTEFLLRGRLLAAMTRSYLNGIRQFALLPVASPIDASSYQSSYLQQIEHLLTESAESVKIRGWASLEFCRLYSSVEDFERLSQLTIWTPEGFQQILGRRHGTFLAYLKTYLLPNPVEIPIDHVQQNKLGKLIRLPQPISIETQTPALSDSIFERRKRQLIQLALPEHPEIEALYNSVALVKTIDAQTFEASISEFLGWSDPVPQRPDPDMEWIQQIAAVGNSSDGYQFEKLVRKSLLKLGFRNSETNPKASLDPDNTGGAGGLDVYCESPYSVVGECKSSQNQTVPNSVTGQLIQLSVTNVGKETFEKSVKIVFAAGSLSSYANRDAISYQMNILRPQTLERLTYLKAKHPGSIDLLELKPYLQQPPFGEDADAKVNKFVDEIWQRIQLRADLIQIVKNYQENTRAESVSAEMIFGAYAAASHVHFQIQQKEIRDILIELASPLAGYLGRRKAEDGSDRFYFLRDLHV